MNQQDKNKKRRNLILIILGFCTVYSLVSIVNHYTFRTYALDLGAYTNALFDYSHFQFNDSSVFKKVEENLLADHFDLYLILFAPLSALFKTYTLLIVQIFFLLLGGLGVYKYFDSDVKTKSVALPAMLFFYLFFGVFSALSFDYHSNVVAATILPWFFLFIRKQKLLLSSILLVFILVSKENVSLWMAAVTLGLAIEYWKIPRLRNYSLISMLACGLFFIAVTSWWMPHFANNNSYPHFHYSFLGDSPKDAIIFLIQHPIESFKVLFVNHTGDIYGDYVKAELHVLLLISGLPILLRKPQYIIMILPVFFQKMFHDNVAMWGVFGQYNIEFAPVMAIGIFSILANLRSGKFVRISSWILVIASLVCTIRTMDNPVTYNNKARLRIYQKQHYQRDYPIGEVHRLLKTIPDDVVVSAQSPFLPHLSLRDNIYQFPNIKNAEYIVYSKMEELYPLDREEFNRLSNELEHSSEWEVISKEDYLTILQRKN